MFTMAVEQFWLWQKNIILLIFEIFRFNSFAHYYENQRQSATRLRKKKTHIEFKIWFDFVHFLLHFIRYFSNSSINSYHSYNYYSCVYCQQGEIHFQLWNTLRVSCSTFHCSIVYCVCGMWYVARGWYSQYKCIDRQQVINIKKNRLLCCLSAFIPQNLNDLKEIIRFVVWAIILRSYQ